MGGGSAYPSAEGSGKDRDSYIEKVIRDFNSYVPPPLPEGVGRPFLGTAIVPSITSGSPFSNMHPVVQPPCSCSFKIKCAEPNELVSIFSEACPNLRLATTENMDVVLAERNPTDEAQLWRKIEVGNDNGWFFDRAGQPGFILVSESHHAALKHGYRPNDLVVLDNKSYKDKTREGTIIWSEGKNDLGQGYRAIRPVTDISLNLGIMGIGKKNRAVKDGTSVFLSEWDKKKPSMRWILQREPEPAHEHNGSLGSYV